jgi:PPOX class probable F420-dependent enzyme
MDRDEAVARLGRARVGRLATVRPDGRPHVVPVVFAVIHGEDGLRAYWAVDSKRKRSHDLQRLRNIAVNPVVELLADGYDEDWSQLWWVRASGPSRTVEDPNERATALAGLVAKYPQYQGGPPDGPVVAIEITRVHGWDALSVSIDGSEAT